MKTLLAASLAVIISVTPTLAWKNVKEMNEVIDQTNFIVGGVCSGTLISTENRLIVTAHHCIKSSIRTRTRDVVDKNGKVEIETFIDLDRVKVQQKDYDEFDQIGSLSYQTEIVGYDKIHDLALLQLVGKKLRSTVAATVLPKGVEIMRGEKVVAVGNPRMMDASVTGGMISSTTRKFKISSQDPTRYIQFDAGIQPGSSGGALFNYKGQYIGTTVAMVPGSVLGLAIPVYELHSLLDETCFASIYDSEADDELCRNPIEELLEDE